MDLRQALLAKGGVKKKIVTVPCEDGTIIEVEVRGLSSDARGHLMTSSMTTNEEGESVTDLAKLQPQLVIAGAYDPTTGQPIFTQFDVEAIGQLSATFLDPIINGVTGLSGMSVAAAMEARGNSNATTTSASASPSPVS